ncbi:unnamed protein product [Macrosiphum euphorbiae]|uniref:Uncharacterized protein n=1 Tax=Macrosiphum euphorbiae TaxID=13131 RepID=A0AAV0WFG8_9HEMI|nr:unnamed protein product [Macrosiphum euphorbiae]
MSRTHTASSELLADLRELERLNEMRWRQFPMSPKTASKPSRAGGQQTNQGTTHYRRGTDKGTASSETHLSSSGFVAGPRGTPPPQFGVIIVLKRGT